MKTKFLTLPLAAFVAASALALAQSQQKHFFENVKTSQLEEVSCDTGQKRLYEGTE
jgi:hypothetical protein